MNECKHPNEQHTIMYWIDDPYDPIPGPYLVKRDSREDAIELVNRWLRKAPLYMRWIKIFRSDNESYECFRWDNPEETLDDRVETRHPEVPLNRSKEDRQRKHLRVLVAIIVMLILINLGILFGMIP